MRKQVFITTELDTIIRGRVFGYLSGYNPIMEVEHYISGQHNGGVYNSFNHNIYGYCYQNPIRYVDPNGKQNEVTAGTASGTSSGTFSRSTSYT